MKTFKVVIKAGGNTSHCATIEAKDVNELKAVLARGEDFEAFGKVEVLFGLEEIDDSRGENRVWSFEAAVSGFTSSGTFQVAGFIFQVGGSAEQHVVAVMDVEMDVVEMVGPFATHEESVAWVRAHDDVFDSMELTDYYGQLVSPEDGLKGMKEAM
jgi:hypothetical protein